MTSLPEKLRLKERAEEDLYFARRDRELVAALRQRQLKKQQAAPEPSPTAGRGCTDGPVPHATFYRRLIERVRHLLRGNAV